MIGTGQTLWKSATNVSSAGRKRGRRPKPLKDLNRGQQIGRGLVNTQFPGLNAPLIDRQTSSVSQARILAPDHQFQEKLMEIRNQLGKKRGFSRKIHPFDRGWAGTKQPGQRLGPPDPVGDENFEGFDSICLELKYVSHGTGNLGQVRRASALMIVGNSKGLIGWGVAKAPDGRMAVRRAKNRAAKQLTFVERLDDRTVYQDFWANCDNSHLFAERVPRGYGLHCHKAIKAICQLVGIEDIHVKVQRSTTNYQAITKAFITGLRNQETFQELAERKRLHVVEFAKERGYMPRIVASPRLAPVRTEEELESDEIFDVEELYTEGRYPWAKGKAEPFYTALPSWERKLWLEYPYRNFEEVKKQLMIDGYVDRWTVKERWEWSRREHNKMLQGLTVLPEGIGLTVIKRPSIEDTEEETKREAEKIKRENKQHGTRILSHQERKLLKKKEQ